MEGGRTVVIAVSSSLPELAKRIAIKFLDIGDNKIALIGPSQERLDNLKGELEQTHATKTQIVALETDFTSPESTGVVSHTIRSHLGAWDVFINVLAYAESSTRTTVRGSDEDDWWRMFEVNVKSLHHIARHFFSKMRQNAVFLNVLSSNIGGAPDGKNSAESASQIAAARTLEFLCKENAPSGLRAINVHVPMTSAAQEHNTPQEFLLWCTTLDAAFLSGRTVSASATRERLRETRQAIENQSNALTIGLQGFSTYQAHVEGSMTWTARPQ